MKRYLLILLTAVSSVAYADDTEVNCQFVVAPIATESCNATAITAPSSDISAGSELCNMLTYFWSDNDTDASIDGVSMPKDGCDDQIAIYSLSGQKQNVLKRGVNIVVDSHGSARKILVK